MAETVYLQCVKDGKLRVRIVSGGYPREANCQFPTDIRVEGRYYSVPRTAITLASGPRGKYFYRVAKSSIKVETGIPVSVGSTGTCTATPMTGGPVAHVDKIFEDVDDPTCCICLENPKTMVFGPCGHFCACETCTPGLKNKCPLCRQVIAFAVTRDMLG